MSYMRMVIVYNGVYVIIIMQISSYCLLENSNFQWIVQLMLIYNYWCEQFQFTVMHMHPQFQCVYDRPSQTKLFPVNFAIDNVTLAQSCSQTCMLVHKYMYIIIVHMH